MNSVKYPLTFFCILAVFHWGLWCTQFKTKHLKRNKYERTIFVDNYKNTISFEYSSFNNGKLLFPSLRCFLFELTFTNVSTWNKLYLTMISVNELYVYFFVYNSPSLMQAYVFRNLSSMSFSLNPHLKGTCCLGSVELVYKKRF